MKKYFYSAIVAMTALFTVSCSQDETLVETSTPAAPASVSFKLDVPTDGMTTRAADANVARYAVVIQNVDDATSPWTVKLAADGTGWKVDYEAGDEQMKVLPLAKEARQMLIETTEYLETLPNDKAKEEHIKRVEEDIFRTYKPKMKKLTYSQGKLLIKLIDRECHSTGYDMIKAFMGPLRAGFWQVFAWGFGASLKKEYDAKGVDRLTERVVLMVEAGQI